jgi:ubiquitin C-terminal hydrolase
MSAFQRDSPGQQEDAQEFLTFLLDVLHEEMQRAMKTIELENVR